MTSDADDQRRDRSNMDDGWRSFKLLLGGFTVLMATILAASTPVGWDLLFGWFFFLDRGLSTFQPDVPTLCVGVIAFSALVMLVHRIGRRCVDAHATELRRTWTWRSTIAVCSAILLLFAAGVAMVAATHQVLWLAAAPNLNSSPLNQWSRPVGPLSVVTWAKLSARKTQSRNNLKQLMLAMHNYHDTLSTFPPGAIISDSGRGYRGWVPPLGPYIGFIDEWNRPPYSPWDDPEVAEYGLGAMPVFVHPDLGWHGQFDDRGFAVMHYAGNVHVFPDNRGLRMSEITDGAENTLAIGEVAENFQPWASPWNRRDPADGINDVPWGFGGPPWQRGAQFALMDGTVRLISRDIDRDVLKALGTPAGNEAVPEW